MNSAAALASDSSSHLRATGRAATAPLEAPPSILGDCVLHLSHATTYEPPLYLFPELLPKVPQGSLPVTVWDAVADAVNVESSHWGIADVSRLHCAETVAERGQGQQQQQVTLGRKSGAGGALMSTLASLVSSNRLLAAGMSATVLQEGKFSSAAIVEELCALKARAKLSDEESAVIMSTHFINLLAWKKLREINYSAPSATLVDAGATTTVNIGALSRKRARPEEDFLDTLKASPDPWSREVDDLRQAGLFVSGAEEGVESKVELLDTLAKLYRRPWVQLRSCGQQTDHVVPAGTINTCSPYADSRKLPGATLDALKDLGWVRTACAAAALPVTSANGLPHASPCQFAVIITSTSVPGATDRVPLTTRCTSFGKFGGPQATPSGTTVYIHGGLARFTKHPEFLSQHQFSIVLRPARRQLRSCFAERNGGGCGEHHNADDEREGEGDDSEEGGREESEDAAEFHEKTPKEFEAWLLNYAGNGVRVCGRRWVLGDTHKLALGTELVVVGDVHVRIVAGGDDNGDSDETGEPMTQHAKNEPGDAESDRAVVKNELLDDE